MLDIGKIKGVLVMVLISDGNSEHAPIVLSYSIRTMVLVKIARGKGILIKIWILPKYSKEHRQFDL